MKILLFAGTTEGRYLARQLASLPVQCLISTATDYGRDMLGAIPFEIRTGRLDQNEMQKMIIENAFDCVIDATHPYAVEAGKNIFDAAQTAGVPCLRVDRPRSARQTDCNYVRDASVAAQALCATQGPVLLTTGTKDLACYTTIPDFAQRIYPRILPGSASALQCEKLGFERSHIIAIHGPFSEELNYAVMNAFGIQHIVTKDSGCEGGFEAKLSAARRLGVNIIIIERPERRQGSDAAEILERVKTMLKDRK